MIIASGAVHAVVNAILKSGGDKMSSRALIDGTSALVALPAVFFLPLPSGAWHWLAASWAVHVVYLFSLIRAFERADMTLAYPVARGIAPVLAASLAVGLGGEPLSVTSACGIGLVSLGVMTVGLGRNVDLRGVGWALVTGVCIAVYTVLDANGVRAAPSALGYIAWTYLVVGFGIGGIFAIIRGPRFLLNAREQWKPGVTAGLLSVVTYSLALYAYRLGDTPRLAALRETSILVALAIGVFILKERVTAWRGAGVVSILAGAVVLLASA
jgi:drug/metabolite transporter (DMT)-like permease